MSYLYLPPVTVCAAGMGTSAVVMVRMCSRHFNVSPSTSISATIFLIFFYGL